MKYFYRRRKMRNRFYIPGSISARDDMPLWDLESLDQVGGVVTMIPSLS